MIVMTYRELIAWILVALLAATSVLLYVYNPGGTQTASVAPPVVNAPAENQPDQTPSTAQESCTDGTKNQDETDVDCGGSCKACGVGKKCTVSTDCSNSECTKGVCVAAAQLSGKLDFSIDSTQYEKNSNTAKLTEVKLMLSNGESTAFDGKVRVYAKSYNDIFYLNQLDAGEPDEDKPYAIIDLPTIGSGKSLSQSFTITGAWMGNWEDPDQTDVLSEGFSVEVQLVDDGGTVIKTVKKAVKI